MSYSRIPSTIAFSLFFLLLPLSATAFQNPCKQMQRDLDREIDNLKNQQRHDLLSCDQPSRRDSAECVSLRTSQAQELESLRDRRTRLKAGCRNYVRRGAVSGVPADDEFVNTYVNYPNCVGYSCEERRKHPHHHYPPGRHPKNPPVTQPGGGGGAGQIKTAQKPGESTGAGQSAKQDKPPRQDTFQSTHHAPDRDTSPAHQRSEAHKAQNQNHDSGSSSSAHSGGSSTSHSGGSATNSNSGAGNSSSTSSASHSSPSSSSSSSTPSAPAQSSSGSSSAGTSSHQDSGASRPK